jgi:hypothetical protein
MKVSSYRLGDLILVSLNQNERDLLTTEHPSSIGADYILLKDDQIGIKKITKIILNHIDKYKDLFPQDIKESTVIHLRLGDVVSGNQGHERTKRPIDIEYYKSLNVDNKKIYIIGKCFFASTSSNNYDECIADSDIYLHSMLENLNAHYFNGGNADVDLCCAVLADNFIQGRGFFSKLIVEVRKEMGKSSIETETYVE